VDQCGIYHNFRPFTRLIFFHLRSISGSSTGCVGADFNEQPHALLGEKKPLACAGQPRSARQQRGEKFGELCIRIVKHCTAPGRQGHLGPARVEHRLRWW